MNFNKESLSEIKVDALREVGSIASGNAASSLSVMLEQEISIGIPTVRILDYNSVVEDLGGNENIQACVMQSLEGDLAGMVMFLMDPFFVKQMLESFAGIEFDKDRHLDEISQSAIQELGNIMVSSYVNAMSGLTGLKIGLSTPSVSLDMVGAILSVPAIYYANISDKMVFIEDRFMTKKHPSSRIIMMPDVQSLAKIMKSLGLDD